MTSRAGNPAPRAKRADARHNAERLATVARNAFAEHGADASLIDIARRAGVSSGTLYRHFPTRAALLAAVYRSEIEALGNLAAELHDSAEPLPALATWLRAFSEYTTTCRGLKGLVAAIDTDTQNALTSWWYATLLPRPPFSNGLSGPAWYVTTSRHTKCCGWSTRSRWRTNRPVSTTTRPGRYST